MQQLKRWKLPFGLQYSGNYHFSAHVLSSFTCGSTRELWIWLCMCQHIQFTQWELGLLTSFANRVSDSSACEMKSNLDLRLLIPQIGSALWCNQYFIMVQWYCWGCRGKLSDFCFCLFALPKFRTTFTFVYYLITTAFIKKKKKK